MIDPFRVMDDLSKLRPVFHSEADFQHAFAWQLHENNPDIKLRLEYPFNTEDGKTNHIDVVAFNGNETIAFELKYKTTQFFAPLSREIFYLKGHYAQDLGRYDYLKDVQRLEEYVAQRKNLSGCAIFLTNDSAYWNPSNRETTICDEFRLTEQRKITGELNWGRTAGKGTIRARESQIKLNGLYECNWCDYYEFEKSDHILGGTKFRYLVIKVANK